MTEEFDGNLFVMKPMGPQSRSMRPYGSSRWKNCLDKSDSCDKLRKHTVQATDTLQGIALKYRTNTDTLRRINKLLYSDSLHLRDIIYVPINTKEFGDDNNEDDDDANDVVADSHKTNCDSSVDTVDAPIASNGQLEDGLSFLKKIESSIQQTKAKVDNYQSRFCSLEPNNNNESSQIFRSNSTTSSASSSSMSQKNGENSRPVQPKSFFSRFQNPFGSVSSSTSTTSSSSRTNSSRSGNVTKTLFYSNNNLYQL